LKHRCHKMPLEQKTNASDFPGVYYCRHMYAGLARYNEGDQEETILVDLEAMQKMSPSFVGKPVIVGVHKEWDEIITDLKAAETPPDFDGYVVECFYNELDGWQWAKFLAVTDAAKESISKGWAVSNAYIPTQFGGGGSYTNIPYDRKVEDGHYTHLAIVPNPRYEGAKILAEEDFKAYNADLKNKKELHNSKKENGRMFKLFRNKKEEIKNISEVKDLEGVNIQLSDDVSVPYEKMLSAVKNAMDEEAANKNKNTGDHGVSTDKMNMDMEVNVGDEKMPLKDLINRYMELENKANKNKHDDDDKDTANKNDGDPAQPRVDADNEPPNLTTTPPNLNQDDDPDKDKDKSNKNSKTKGDHFNELKNAAAKSTHYKNTPVDLGIHRVARGKQRYGSDRFAK